MTGSKAIRYLLVEDSQDHAELVTSILREADERNSIVHVTDGEQALAYLRKQPPYGDDSIALPDLILLDLKMPRLNGMDTLEHLKADDMLKHIPVVVVSTSRTDQEVARCHELGASSFIAKPVRFDELADKIRGLNRYWSRTSEIPKLQGR